MNNIYIWICLQTKDLLMASSWITNWNLHEIWSCLQKLIEWNLKEAQENVGTRRAAFWRMLFPSNNAARRVPTYGAMKANNILQNRPTPFLEQGGHHRSIMCIVFVLLVTIMNTVSFNNWVQRYDNIFMPAILFYMDFLLLPTTFRHFGSAENTSSRQ